MAIAVQATEAKKAVERAASQRARQPDAPPRNDFEDALDQAGRNQEPAPVEKPRPAKKSEKAEKPADAPPGDEAPVVDEGESADQPDAEAAPEAIETPVADEEFVVDVPVEPGTEEAPALPLDATPVVEFPIAPAVPAATPNPEHDAQEVPADGAPVDETEPAFDVAPKTPALSTFELDGLEEAAGGAMESTAAEPPEARPVAVKQTSAKSAVTPLNSPVPSAPQAKAEPASQSQSIPAPANAAVQSIESIASPDTPASSTPSHAIDKPAPDVASNAAPAADSQKPQATAPAGKPASLPEAAPPELRFAQENHDRIVTNVRAQLLPGGGSMQIRLDPPELGALKVMVEMRDGVMTATFQTSSDEATRLLSHSLNQLKHVLEGQGVNVERLQVQQAPKSEQSRGGDEQNQSQQNWSDEHAAKQEQQRKELLRRAWRKAGGLGDPIDFMA